MNTSKPLLHQKILRSIFTVGLLILFFFIINILVIGGNEFVYRLNRFLASPLSILTSFMALFLWRQMKTGTPSYHLWVNLLIGWICWVFAELFWATYSPRGLDPLADLFFLSGYIPLSIGFLSYMRKLPGRPDIFQYAILGSVSVIAGIATFTYVFVPTLQSYDLE